jgi:alpha/beta superfamily hydrolase
MPAAADAGVHLLRPDVRESGPPGGEHDRGQPEGEAYQHNRAHHTDCNS